MIHQIRLRYNQYIMMKVSLDLEPLAIHHAIQNSSLPDLLKMCNLNCQSFMSNDVNL